MILQWCKWAFSTLLACLLFLTVLLIVTPQGRTGIRTALFLPQILPGFPVKPQEWFTSPPTRERISFPIASGKGKADIYQPSSPGKHSAILLFLGVNPAGSEDPRVVGLAEGLARSGVVVMIPWSDNMTQRRVSVDEIDNLVNAFQYMIGLENVDPQHSGVGGFCVGASFTMVAAQDHRIRDQVKFVNFFGGYYNAKDLITSVVSSTRFDTTHQQSWTPDALSTEVVGIHLIEGLHDSGERSLLKQIFIKQNASSDSKIIASLSPKAKIVYELLMGPTLDEAKSLIETLPSTTIETLQAISPASNINNLKARPLIMHDRADSLVPSEESKRLARALSTNNEAYYTEFSLFDHVDPTRTVSLPIYLKELWKLYLHMYNVLRELS